MGSSGNLRGSLVDLGEAGGLGFLGPLWALGILATVCRYEYQEVICLLPELCSQLFRHFGGYNSVINVRR